ncbi:MAG: radical SAM protein [Desulfotignum sp.]|nr:radical SAM protein [Desulfotignum sp.]
MTGSPLVIPVFIPHSGCPHQCAFCNQTVLTGETSQVPDAGRVAEIIQTYLDRSMPRSRVEVAFFGGNFLGLASGRITDLMESVQPFLDSGVVHGIRFSTRPDTVTKNRMEQIAHYPIRLVELGVQSMDDRVLARVKRGHTREDTCRAMDLLRAFKINAGVQIMAGLPGDSLDGVIQTSQILAKMHPSTARIYPALVLKNTLLARWYHNGTYQPLTLDQAVEVTSRAYRIFTQAGVTVIRMGVQVSAFEMASVLAGPCHPAFGHLVHSRMMYQTVVQKIQALGSVQGSGMIRLRVHPSGEARLRGHRNGNLLRLKNRFPKIDFRVQGDPAVGPGQIDIVKFPV